MANNHIKQTKQFEKEDETMSKESTELQKNKKEKEKSVHPTDTVDEGITWQFTQTLGNVLDDHS